MFGELIQIGSIFLTMNSVSKLYDDPIRFKYPGAKIWFDETMCNCHAD